MIEEATEKSLWDESITRKNIQNRTNSIWNQSTEHLRRIITFSSSINPHFTRRSYHATHVTVKQATAGDRGPDSTTLPTASFTVLSVSNFIMHCSYKTHYLLSLSIIYPCIHAFHMLASNWQLDFEPVKVQTFLRYCSVLNLFSPIVVCDSFNSFLVTQWWRCLFFL